MSLWFYVLFSLSALSLWAFWRRASRAYRMPVAVILGAYGITTVLGATVIGVLHNNLLWKVLTGDVALDVSMIRDTDSFRYWFLLYIPFIVVPGMLAVIGRNVRPRGLVADAVKVFDGDVDVLSYSVVLVALVGYCVFAIVRGGFAGNLLQAATLAGDVRTLIILRMHMARALDPNVYAVIFVGIPTLCSIALFQYLRQKRTAWFLLLAAGVLSDVTLVLSTIQKGAVFVLILGLVLGYVTLRPIRLWVMGSLTAAGVGLLTALQLVLVGEWSVYRTVVLLFFRMAVCFPYYVNVYPDLQPFQGMNYGLGILGLGTVINDNEVTFNYMYPREFSVQGNATAAAHIRGYTQGGIPATLIYLVIIVIALMLIARLKVAMHGPLTFALYVQSLIFLYFLSQTSLREALLDSYGLRYALLAVALVWGCRRILQLATEATTAAARRQLPKASGAG